MNNLAVKLLWLAAITFLGTAIVFLVWPLTLAQLVDMPLDSPTARIDFLATYGGLQGGVGVLLAICARRRELTRLGLIATGCALGGFAVGRLFGLVSTPGSPRPIIYMYLALELSGTAVAFILARVVSVHEKRVPMTR